MTKSKSKNIIVIFLCFVILFTSVSCVKVDKSKFDQTFYFNDLYYSKPDYDLFLELFDYILENRDSFKEAIAINNKYCQMVEIYNNILFCQNYLSIREALNSKDKYLIDAHYYIRNIIDDANTKILLASKYIRERKCGWFYRLINGKDSDAYIFPDCSGVFLDDFSNGDNNVQKIAIQINYLDSALYEEQTIFGDGYEYDYLVPPGMKNFDENGVWVLTEAEIKNLYKLGFTSYNVYTLMMFDLYSVKSSSMTSDLKTLYSLYRERSSDLLFNNFEEYANSLNSTSYSAAQVIETGENEVQYLLDLRTELINSIDENVKNDINALFLEKFNDDIMEFVVPLFTRIDKGLVTTLESSVENGSINLIFDEYEKSDSFVTTIYGYNKAFMFYNPGDEPSIDNFVDFLYTFGVFQYLSNSSDVSKTFQNKSEMVNAGNSLVLESIKYLGLIFTDSVSANTAKNLVLINLINKSLMSFAKTEFNYEIGKNKKYDYASISSRYFEILAKYGLTGKVVKDNLCLDWILDDNIYKNPLSYYENAIITLNLIKNYTAKE